MSVFTKAAFLGALLVAAGPVMASDTATPSEAPLVTMYKDPSCGCCAAWGDHMAANGFRVVVKNTDALDQVKAMLNVPAPLQSCHTATVDGYVIEGHVPAADVARLLKDKPAVAGLAVPGMPQSAPGMDVPGADDHYDVIGFDTQGRMTRVNTY